MKKKGRKHKNSDNISDRMYQLTFIKYNFSSIIYQMSSDIIYQMSSDIIYQISSCNYDLSTNQLQNKAKPQFKTNCGFLVG